MSNYDGDGNPQTVTTKAGLTLSLTYNQEDEVTQITGLGSTNTFVYDGDGRRVSKSDSSGTTSFVYDGSSVTTEVGASVTTYRLPGVGEFNSVSGQSYEMVDQLGSTMAEVSGAATFLGQYNYDGYGLESDLNGRPSQATAFRFAGKHGYLTDKDSGMVLCGARYYLPILGRFLTQDPIGHDRGLNLYGYCEDNPLKCVEPIGYQGVKQYFRDVDGVVAGYGDATWGTLKSPYTAAQYLGAWSRHDLNSGFLKAGLLAGWIELASGLTGEAGPRGFGSSFGSVLIAAGTAGNAFAEGNAFSRVQWITHGVTAAGWDAIEASGGLLAGAFVQRGHGSLGGWLLSGILLNYRFSSKAKFLVPRSLLKAPPGP